MPYFIFFIIMALWIQLGLFAANPFAIDFQQKLELTNEDYIEVQNKLRSIYVNVEKTVEELYLNQCVDGNFTTMDDLKGRCTKGLTRTLIDPSRELYPIKRLQKIGQGGDRCIVCYITFDGKYPEYLRSLIAALKKERFDGYVLYRIGGWPNPTGEEINYVGVPYSFKIFSMVEAYQYGFNQVLWLDVACYPLREIHSLFDKIAARGALVNFVQPHNCAPYIFPSSLRLLQEKTGTDILQSGTVNTPIFGLKMDDPFVQEVITMYYECAKLGWPFLSCFPEEFVLGAIIRKQKYERWRVDVPLLFGMDEKDSLELFELARQKGFYFYHRAGR